MLLIKRFVNHNLRVKKKKHYQAIGGTILLLFSTRSLNEQTTPERMEYSVLLMHTLLYIDYTWKIHIDGDNAAMQTIHIRWVNVSNILLVDHWIVHAWKATRKNDDDMQ